MLCHYAERHILFSIMLSVVILNVVMLSVVAPTIISHKYNIWEVGQRFYQYPMSEHPVYPIIALGEVVVTWVQPKTPQGHP